MKIKTTAKKLKQGLQVVEGALPTRTPIPAATHVKISVTGKSLTLTTTNLHTLIHFTFQVEGLKDGIAVVPAKRLLDFCKTLSSEEIELTRDGKRLSIRAGRALLELPVMSDDEFPAAPVTTGRTLQVKQAELKEALRLTSFAAEQNTDRYILNGCYLTVSPDGKSCSLLATDSRRLARYSFAPTKTPEEPEKIKFLVPQAVAKLLQDHLAYETDAIITQGERHVSVQFALETGESYYLHFNQVEGNYPDCRALIPETSSKNTINREAMLQALKRAISAVDTTGRVQLTFNPLAVEIEAAAASSASTTAGRTVEPVPAQYCGKIMTATFTPKYLVEVLEELTGETVDFDIKGEEQPLIITSNEYIYLNMPLRA